MPTEPLRVRVVAETSERRCDGLEAKVVRLLGMTVRQLTYRVRKYEITLKRL